MSNTDDKFIKINGDLSSKFTKTSSKFLISLSGVFSIICFIFAAVCLIIPNNLVITNVDGHYVIDKIVYGAWNSHIKWESLNESDTTNLIDDSSYINWKGITVIATLVISVLLFTSAFLVEKRFFISSSTFALIVVTLGTTIISSLIVLLARPDFPASISNSFSYDTTYIFRQNFSIDNANNIVISTGYTWMGLLMVVVNGSLGFLRAILLIHSLMKLYTKTVQSFRN